MRSLPLWHRRDLVDLDVLRCMVHSGKLGKLFGAF